MWRPSGTSATPRRAIRSGLEPRRERPWSRTSPEAILTTPITACSVDDLPAPLGPTRPTISPRPTSRSRPRTAGTPPYDTTSFSRTSAGSDITARASQIGVRDVDVVPDLLGCALGERAALVEDVDPVADVEDQRDVVVDEQHA